MATNNLSAQSVVLDLLSYIGVSGFTPPEADQALNQPGLDAVDVRRAIAAVNRGLQDIQRYGPQSMKEAQRATMLVAPTALTLNIAHGARTAVASAPPPAAARGCSLLISDDGDINRILAYPSGNNITLLRPYMGVTNAAVSATVFYDCASLDADVQAVESPVYISGKIELFKAQDLQQFERLRCRYWLEDWGAGFVWAWETVANRLGTPALYMTERQRDGTVWLRVTPIPPADVDVSFQCKLRAERITEAVLDQTGATDPGYYFTSLHDDEVETLLLPLARWRFFTHPALKNAETRQSVKDEFTEVYGTLTNGQTLETETADDKAVFI